jgi:hypothetical protein
MAFTTALDTLVSEVVNIAEVFNHLLIFFRNYTLICYSGELSVKGFNLPDILRVLIYLYIEVSYYS